MGSIPLKFMLSQCLNESFNKVASIYWVPTGRNYSRKGDFITNYKVCPQTLDLGLQSLSIAIWSKFR